MIHGNQREAPVKKQVIVRRDLAALDVPWREGIVTQCLRAGNCVYLGGQTGFDLDGLFVRSGDAGDQARQACENIKTLVGMAGGQLSDVVKLVVYVTDRPASLATARVLSRFFPDVLPCTTEYIVPALARDDLQVEIDAWAFIDDDQARKRLLRTRDTGDAREAQGYRAGNLVVLQGQAGCTLDGQRVGLGSPATQAGQALENMGVLMQLAGGSLDDVVRLGKAVTKREHRTTTYPVIGRCWPGLPPPGTGLIVDGLATEGQDIVIDGWGFIESGDATRRIVRTHDLLAAEMPGATGRATQCVRAGNMVFLQGQVAWTLEGRLVASGDPVSQARQAMENIKALMELAGGSLSDVVRFVLYVTDRTVRDAIYPLLNTFWGGLWPCGTSVVVRGLARPELLVEIDAYGFIDDAEKAS